MNKQSIPLIVAIALLGSGVYYLMESISYTRDFQAETGKIVSCANRHITASGPKKQFKNDGEKFFPVVETANGEQLTSRRHYSNEANCNESIGETVDLLVDGNNAVINDFYNLWLTPTVLIAFSGLFFFMYSKGQKPRRSQPFN